MNERTPNIIQRISTSADICTVQKWERSYFTRYWVDNSANPCCRVVWRPGAVPQWDIQGGGHGGAPRLQVQPRRGQVIGCAGSRDQMLTPDWSAGSTWRWCGWAAPSPTCPTSRPSVCRRSAETPRWAGSQHWISVHTSQQLASVQCSPILTSIYKLFREGPSKCLLHSIYMTLGHLSWF